MWGRCWATGPLGTFFRNKNDESFEIKNSTKKSLLWFWESPVFGNLLPIVGFEHIIDDFGWIFDQMYGFFQFRYCLREIVTSSILTRFQKYYMWILYALKSYDPNSFISSTFDAIRSRYHKENHRCSWANFSKIHLHHPITRSVGWGFKRTGWCKNHSKQRKNVMSASH